MLQQLSLIAASCGLLLGAGCSNSVESAPEPEPKAVRPPPPALVLPANGAYSGSANMQHPRARRPVFQWRQPVFAEAMTYQIEITSECEPGRIRTCRFASPAIVKRDLVGTQWQPDRDLAIRSKAPVGKRYFWRVRACASQGRCSAWSRTRYLEVGRTRGDFDGDGYSDVAVGAPLIDNGGADRGSVFIYFGGRAGIERVTRLNDPRGGDGAAFGIAVAVAGDVNADGFDDLLVGASGANDARGYAYLYFGSKMGIRSRTYQELTRRRGRAQDWFGAAVAGAGDVDSDGYDDLLIGASGDNRTGQDWGVAYLYRGSAGGIAEEPPILLGVPSPTNFDQFGYALIGAGDLNGDGFDDVAIGSPAIDIAGMETGQDRGAVYLFHGSAVGLLDTPFAKLEAPVPLDHDRFGQSIGGVMDVDADGYGDLVVGAPGRDSPVLDGGTAYLYRGGPEGLTTVPDRVLQDINGDEYDRFGTSAASAGDINGDGFDDIIIGASGRHRGRALLYYGSREGIPPQSTLILRDPLGDGFNDFAEAVGGAGDINGDGFDDIIIGASGADNGGTFRGSIVIYAGTENGIVPKRPLRRDNPDTGIHDHFGHVVAGR